jgi:hypothetical protein
MREPSGRIAVSSDMRSAFMVIIRGTDNLMSNIPSKEAMLRIAEDHEHLAEWAEERAKRSA